MIGLDTNILLRSLLADDPAQSPLARQLIRSAAPGTLFIADVVLAELVWTLGRRFGAGKSRILNVLNDLIRSSEFVFEDRPGLRAAVADFTSSRADFSDFLIALSGKRSGVSRTVSFDQDAIDASLFSPLTE